jgi:hypothetical protein
MIVYEIPKPLLMVYAKEDKPFLSFDQFDNLVQLYRDEYFACQYIDGFIWDIGVRYNFWTRDTSNRYYRHIFFKDIPKPIRISFEIPHITKNATIPLIISIFDDDGVYFTQTQHVLVELNRFHEFQDDKYRDDPWKICSWRKVDTVRDCVFEHCRIIKDVA